MMEGENRGLKAIDVKNKTGFVEFEVLNFPLPPPPHKKVE